MITRLECADRILTRVPHTESEKIATLTHIKKHLRVSTEILHLQQVLKIFFCETSHNGPPRPFEDASVVAVSVTANHSAMLQCLFVVIQSCVH
jgi:hypothetical protein